MRATTTSLAAAASADAGSACANRTNAAPAGSRARRKRSAGGARVTQGRVLGNHSAGRSPNQPPRPLQPVRKPIPRRRQAMGAVHVQTQMLAAPTAVMTQQTLVGLLEHPEQPMPIDIANPGCRHNALTTPCKPLLSKVDDPPSPCRRNHHSPTERTTAPMTSTPRNRLTPHSHRGPQRRSALSPGLHTAEVDSTPIQMTTQRQIREPAGPAARPSNSGSPSGWTLGGCPDLLRWPIGVRDDHRRR